MASATESGPLTPRSQQQEFYEYFGNKNRVTWDLYVLNNDKEALERKIGFALFGPPQNLPKTALSDHHTGYDKKQVAIIEKIYEQIIAQNQYSLYVNEIHMSIVFVLCVSDSKGVPKIPVSDKTELSCYPYPVFRVRKCVKDNLDKGDEDGCKRCFIFIDHEGRAYKSWDKYLKNNNLPKGVLVVPKNGIYNATTSNDLEEKVILTEHLSPACSLVRKARNVGDVAGLVASVGATCVGVAALVPAIPVAAGVLGGAAIAGSAAGAYSVVRSSFNLADRSEHEQSINIKDKEARNDWLGIASGSFGLAAGGATKLLGNFVARGVNISTSGKHVVNVLNGVSVAMNGMNAAYGVYQIFDIIINENEAPSPLLLFQVSTSIFFFTHSVINLKTADSIIRDRQDEIINKYKSDLRSNRHRKMFNKMEKETIRLAGNEVSGKGDVIRGINSIQNKDDFFAGALRINKGLNKNSVKISFSPDGSAVLNNVEIIDPMKFWSQGQSQQFSTYSNLPPPPSGKVTKAQLLSTEKTVNNAISLAIANKTTVLCRMVQLIKDIQTTDRRVLIEKFSFYLCSFRTEIQNIFMQFLCEFMAKTEEILRSKLEVIVPNIGEQINYLFDFLYAYLSKETYNLLKNQVTNRNSFISEMENVITSLCNERHINNLLSNLFDHLEEIIKQRNIFENTRGRISCELCGGHYYNKAN